MTDFYNYLDNNTLAWLCKIDGKIYGNAVPIQIPINTEVIDLLYKDMKKVLKGIGPQAHIPLIRKDLE